MFFHKLSLDVLVKEIAEREILPVIGLSIDQIADEVEKRTGKRPSKSVVWSSLQRLGAVSRGRKFVYKHNEGKES